MTDTTTSIYTIKQRLLGIRNVLLLSIVEGSLWLKTLVEIVGQTHLSVRSTFSAISVTQTDMIKADRLLRNVPIRGVVIS